MFASRAANTQLSEVEEAVEQWMDWRPLLPEESAFASPSPSAPPVLLGASPASSSTFAGSVKPPKTPLSPSHAGGLHALVTAWTNAERHPATARLLHLLKRHREIPNKILCSVDYGLFRMATSVLQLPDSERYFKCFELFDILLSQELLSAVERMELPSSLAGQLGFVILQILSPLCGGNRRGAPSVLFPSTLSSSSSSAAFPFQFDEFATIVRSYCTAESRVAFAHTVLTADVSFALQKKHREEAWAIVADSCVEALEGIPTLSTAAYNRGEGVVSEYARPPAARDRRRSSGIFSSGNSALGSRADEDRDNRSSAIRCDWSAIFRHSTATMLLSNAQDTAAEGNRRATSSAFTDDYEALATLQLEAAGGLLLSPSCFSDTHFVSDLEAVISILRLGSEFVEGMTAKLNSAVVQQNALKRTGRDQTADQGADSGGSGVVDYESASHTVRSLLIALSSWIDYHLKGMKSPPASMTLQWEQLAGVTTSICIRLMEMHRQRFSEELRRHGSSFRWVVGADGKRGTTGGDSGSAGPTGVSELEERECQSAVMVIAELLAALPGSLLTHVPRTSDAAALLVFFSQYFYQTKAAVAWSRKVMLTGVLALCDTPRRWCLASLWIGPLSFVELFVHCFGPLGLTTAHTLAHGGTTAGGDSGNGKPTAPLSAAERRRRRVHPRRGGVASETPDDAPHAVAGDDGAEPTLADRDWLTLMKRLKEIWAVDPNKFSLPVLGNEPLRQGLCESGSGCFVESWLDLACELSRHIYNAGSKALPPIEERQLQSSAKEVKGSKKDQIPAKGCMSSICAVAANSVGYLIRQLTQRPRWPSAITALIYLIRADPAVLQWKDNCEAISAAAHSMCTLLAAKQEQEELWSLQHGSDSRSTTPAQAEGTAQPQSPSVLAKRLFETDEGLVNEDAFFLSSPFRLLLAYCVRNAPNEFLRDTLLWRAWELADASTAASVMATASYAKRHASYQAQLPAFANGFLLASCLAAFMEPSVGIKEPEFTSVHAWEMQQAASSTLLTPPTLSETSPLAPATPHFGTWQLIEKERRQIVAELKARFPEETLAAQRTQGPYSADLAVQAMRDFSLGFIHNTAMMFRSGVEADEKQQRHHLLGWMAAAEEALMMREYLHEQYLKQESTTGTCTGGAPAWTEAAQPTATPAYRSYDPAPPRSSAIHSGRDGARLAARATSRLSTASQQDKAQQQEDAATIHKLKEMLGRQKSRGDMLQSDLKRQDDELVFQRRVLGNQRQELDMANSVIVLLSEELAAMGVDVRQLPRLQALAAGQQCMQHSSTSAEPKAGRQTPTPPPS